MTNQKYMPDGAAAPVISGLAVGIALVVLFSVMIIPNSMLSDEDIISKYSEILEVRYFLDKYPDAIAEVNRNPNDEYLMITFSVEKKVFDLPTNSQNENGETAVFLGNTGVHLLGINVYTKPNHLSLAIFCGMVGMTGEWGLNGIDMVDEAEKECFQATTGEVAQKEPTSEGGVEAIAIDFSPIIGEQDIIVNKGQTVKIPVMIESDKETEKVLTLSIIPSGDVPDSSQLQLSFDKDSIVLSKDDIMQGKARDSGYGRLIRDVGFLIVSASPSTKAGTYSYGLEANYEGNGGDGMGAGEVFRVTVVE